MAVGFCSVRNSLFAFMRRAFLQVDDVEVLMILLDLEGVCTNDSFGILIDKKAIE